MTKIFSIDVSGIPPNLTHISCVSFDMHRSDKIFKYLRKDFQGYINKKGKHLDPTVLADILSFLDKHKIVSYSTIYSKNNWTAAFKMVPRNRALKIEKVCGIIYYLLLKPNSKYGKTYVVHACKEDFMKIDTVISACRKIAKMRGMDYNITTGSDKYDNYIKIADYVVSATRKIKVEQLQSFKYYNLIKAHLPEEYVKKVFS